MNFAAAAYKFKGFLRPTKSAAVLGCLAIAALGIGAGPGHAFVRVGMDIVATPVNADADGTFMNGMKYLFRADVTENNSYTVNNNTQTTWVPQSNRPVFNYLRVFTCGDQVTCSTTSGVASQGTWDTNPTITNLQQFTVQSSTAGVPYQPNFSMSFGATGSSTGLRFDLNTMQTGANMTDLTIGSEFSLNPLLFPSITNWYPAGTTPLRASLTANNIIQNLALAVPGTTGQLIPSGPGSQMLMVFMGEAKQIEFNINSVTFTSVPGPLPLAGSLIAFSYSRKIRNRIQSSKQAA